MKIMIPVLLFLYTFQSYGNCSGSPLKISDIKSFFNPGEMQSRYFTTLDLMKRVRRCNTFSGCEQWSSPKATLSLGEIINSYDSERRYLHFPTDGEAYFKINEQGKIKLLIDFYSLDISAQVQFKLSSTKISLPSNAYFRPSGAFAHPVAFVSYYDEDDRVPVSLKGIITNNCIELKSSFTREVEGIIYDEFEILLKGSF